MDKGRGGTIFQFGLLRIQAQMGVLVLSQEKTESVLGIVDRHVGHERCRSLGHGNHSQVFLGYLGSQVLDIFRTVPGFHHMVGLVGLDQLLLVEGHRSQVGQDPRVLQRLQDSQKGRSMHEKTKTLR